MLITDIVENDLLLYRSSYAVRSAITATADRASCSAQRLYIVASR